MKRKIVKLTILIIFGCFASNNSYSQEVNMNRWIDIKFSPEWLSYEGYRIDLDFVGDSANTKIKVVSGYYQRTKTIGEDWGWTDTEFFIGADSMRIYGNVKKLEARHNIAINIINLDNNSEVTQLLVSGHVSQLDISDCDNLEALECSMCNFDSIDLSNFTELKHLSLTGNPNLLNLDLSNQTKLEYLYINDTRFPNINISNLKELKNLVCYNTYLTSLDIRGLEKLKMIDCYNTKISTAGYDSIFCALPETDTYRDILVYSEYLPSTYDTIMATNSQNAISKGWTVLQDLEAFVNPEYPSGGLVELFPTNGTFDCSKIGIEEIDLDIVETKVYPNPAIYRLNIETKEVVQRLEVYDALGRKTISKAPNQNNFSLDISNLEKGIYILKLQTIEGIGSYKVVKN